MDPAEPFGSTEENSRHTFAVSAPPQTERFPRTISFDLLTSAELLFVRSVENRDSDRVRFEVCLSVRVVFAPDCFFENPRFKKPWTVDIFMSGLQNPS